MWILEPIVTGFGDATEAAIKAPAEIQWVANRKGGGAQQSNTVRVIFLVNKNGFVELVILTPLFTSLNARPPGNI